ncbi:MAG: hypothetical protein ACKOXP_07660 [Flavobacteriales bacterium]
MTSTLLIILAVTVLAVMTFLKKANQSLHFTLLSVAMGILLIPSFFHFDKNHAFTLILLLVLYGNAFRQFNQAK